MSAIDKTKPDSQNPQTADVRLNFERAADELDGHEERLAAVEGGMVPVVEELVDHEERISDLEEAGPGEPGPPGPVGAGFGGSSTDLREASLGPTTLSIGTGYAYDVASRVRATSVVSPEAWMEGQVTGYAAGLLAFTADACGEQLYKSDWQVSLVGQVGAKGDPGDPGTGYQLTSEKGNPDGYAGLDGLGNLEQNLAGQAYSLGVLGGVQDLWGYPTPQVMRVEVDVLGERFYNDLTIDTEGIPELFNCPQAICDLLNAQTEVDPVLSGVFFDFVQDEVSLEVMYFAYSKDKTGEYLWNRLRIIAPAWGPTHDLAVQLKMGAYNGGSEPVAKRDVYHDIARLHAEVRKMLARFLRSVVGRADLSSQCDGEQDTFILPEGYEVGSLEVWVDGLYQGVAPTHFEEVDSLHFRFNDYVLTADSELVVRYVLKAA